MKTYFWNQQVAGVITELHQADIKAWEFSRDIDIRPVVMMLGNAKLTLPNSEKTNPISGEWNDYTFYQIENRGVAYGFGIKFNTLDEFINYYQSNITY